MLLLRYRPMATPDYTIKTVDGTYVYNVPNPDALREKLIPLNSEGADILGRRLGGTPSRASLLRWRTHGYPIDRDGPRVVLPHVTHLKKVKTSVEAMRRWILVVQMVAQEIRDAGSLAEWKSQKEKAGV